MGRKKRIVPNGGALIEVSTRTDKGCCALIPNSKTTRRILGVIGKAQQHYPQVELHAFVFLSNHYHLLAWFPDAPTLSGFVGFLNGNISRELKHCTDWQGRLWGGRFHSGLFADDESSIHFLDYMLRHGVKEGLVASPERWLGASSLPWMLRGEQIVGEWVDRTRMSEMTPAGRVPIEADFTEEIEVKLTPLPIWQDLPDNMWRAEVTLMVEAIAEDAALAQEQAEKAADVGSGEAPGVFGFEAVLAQDPRQWRPEPISEVAPRVHAACPLRREELLDALRSIEEAWAAARAAEKSGQVGVDYPVGTWRPSLGWVRAEPQALAA